MQYQQIKTTMYLGRNIDNSQIPLSDGFVYDFALSRFLKVVVTPEFPGFTVQHADGYWRGELESVVILTVLHDGAESALDKLASIAHAYRIQFHQEAVLVEHSSVNWSLV